MSPWVYALPPTPRTDTARLATAINALREAGWEGVDEISAKLASHEVENGADFADTLVYWVGVSVHDTPNIRLWHKLCAWYDNGEVTTLPEELKGEACI